MIFTTLTYLLIGLGMIYLVGIAMILLGVLKGKEGKNTDMPHVSVVIAARNEEEHIGDCLAALTVQTYPEQKYEILVVDDQSEDGTSQIVDEWVKKTHTVRLLHVGPEPSPLVGKKRALDVGIRQSTGTIILTTDADCVVKPTWIQGLVRAFEPQVGLVAGYSYTEQRGETVSLLQKLRSLERIAVAAVAAGSMSLGRGITCTGQNLAYRKKAYADVSGFSQIGHLLSGDDDLFLHLIHHYTNWETTYSFSRETHVRTKAPVTLAHFIQQEKRRTSKGFCYPLWLTLLLAGTYGFYLILFAALSFSFLYWNRLHIAWIVFGAKALGECILLLTICSRLHRKDLLALFPIAEIVHVPYFILFGLWGTFGRYKWK